MKRKRVDDRNTVHAIKTTTAAAATLATNKCTMGQTTETKPHQRSAVREIELEINKHESEANGFVSILLLLLRALRLSDQCTEPITYGVFLFISALNENDYHEVFD